MIRLVHRVLGIFSVPVANTELLRAQFAMLSRLVPMLYLILLVNAWVLTATFANQAPAWLTYYATAALSAFCVFRLVRWWSLRDARLSDEQMIAEFRRTLWVSAMLSVVCPLWALALFPYGNQAAQYHVAVFLAFSLVSAMFCLIHLRAAAVLFAGVSGPIVALHFLFAADITFVAIAVNCLLVLVALLVVVFIQHRDFARMINAQTNARRKHEEQARLLRMMDDMPVAVMTVEPDTFKINYANETSKTLIRKIEHLLPIKADDLVGTSIDVFHRNPRHQRRLLSHPKNLPHNARISLGPEVLDLKVSAVTGHDGSYIGPMLTWALVTKEAEAENRIFQLAHYDTLTGLPNRHSFREELAKALASPGNRISLLYIGLDGFKIINDTHGHSVGDMLLGEVANRLRAICNGPAVTVGRLAGDEFAVLLPHNDEAGATALADAIIDALAEPYHLNGGGSILLGASVGIALAPDHGEDAHALFVRADLALHAAKTTGKGRACMFSTEMETRIQERARLETDLRQALEAGEGLFVFYQPIVDIETGKQTAREALVRWHHPQRGWVSPGEFVPIAEQSGLIDRLGAFVLDTACRDAAEWQQDERVAVNISAAQLGKGTIASAVMAALTRSGLSPHRLEIEVTETALLGAEASGISDLRRVRALGVRVALDDFGTGYSSLSHLQMFPFDKIKIDGSFVRNAVERPESAAVIRAVADLGKRLRVTTVAEGVETQAQFERVREEGCTEIQGYLYGRPAPTDDDASKIEALNKAGSPTVAA